MTSNSPPFDGEPGKVYAPWSSAQVEALTRRQQVGHPYTCPHHSDSALLPTPSGWVCMPSAWTGRRQIMCPYRQRWARVEDMA